MASILKNWTFAILYLNFVVSFGQSQAMASKIAVTEALAGPAVKRATSFFLNQKIIGYRPTISQPRSKMFTEEEANKILPPKVKFVDEQHETYQTLSPSRFCRICEEKL